MERALLVDRVDLRSWARSRVQGALHAREEHAEAPPATRADAPPTAPTAALPTAPTAAPPTAPTAAQSAEPPRSSVDLEEGRAESPRPCDDVEESYADFEEGRAETPRPDATALPLHQLEACEAVRRREVFRL